MTPASTMLDKHLDAEKAKRKEKEEADKTRSEESLNTAREVKACIEAKYGSQYTCELIWEPHGLVVRPPKVRITDTFGGRNPLEISFVNGRAALDAQMAEIARFILGR